MNLSIIIPCYNEEKNIPLILEKFKKTITNETVEIILVENGSTDNSKTVITGLLPRYPFAKIVPVPVNKGYGYGILQGLKNASGDFIGWTHADLQTDPADVIEAYHKLEKSSWNTQIYVKGKRKGRGVTDCIFTLGMSVFETLYLRKFLYDINAQPNIFSREFFTTWKNPPFDFSLDLYALYMARLKKLRILRFDVRFPPRIYGKSNWNTGLRAKWGFIKRTFSFSRRLKKDGFI